jgi:HEAT repeat protein
MDEFFIALERIVGRLASPGRERTRDAVEAVLRAGGDTFEGLLEVLADGAQPDDVRGTCAWLLGRFGNQRAIAPLVRALSDGAPAVRSDAALALGLLGAEEAVDPLVAMIDGDADAGVRCVAASALGQLGDPRARAPLEALLADAARPAALRGEAPEALIGLAGREASLPALLAALDDAEAEVRFWAAFALGELGDARALDALDRLASDAAPIPGYSTVGEEARDAAAKLRAPRE